MAVQMLTFWLLRWQIEEEAVKMAQYTEFRFVCVVGGMCQHATLIVCQLERA
jgi:hypothetical protein